MIIVAHPLHNQGQGEGAGGKLPQGLKFQGALSHASRCEGPNKVNQQ